MNRLLPMNRAKLLLAILVIAGATSEIHAQNWTPSFFSGKDKNTTASTRGTGERNDNEQNPLRFWLTDAPRYGFARSGEQEQTREEDWNGAGRRASATRSAREEVSGGGGVEGRTGG